MIEPELVEKQFPFAPAIGKLHNSYVSTLFHFYTFLICVYFKPSKIRNGQFNLLHSNNDMYHI